MALHRLEGVLSLQKTLSGGRWQTLRKTIIKEKGVRCEYCGSKRRILEAHEVWNFIEENNEHSLDVLAKWNINQREVFKHSGILKFMLCDRAVVQQLIDIRLLCRPCHYLDHASHKQPAGTLVIRSEFGKYSDWWKDTAAAEEAQLQAEAAAGWSFEQWDYDADL
jgi:hypothetical protein